MMLSGTATLNTSTAVAVVGCPGKGSVYLSNTGANPAVIGTGAATVSGNGVTLAAGASITLPIGSGTIYAISTTGATTLVYFLGGA